jgi:hypothetical protein
MLTQTRLLLDVLLQLAKGDLVQQLRHPRENYRLRVICL